MSAAMFCKVYYNFEKVLNNIDCFYGKVKVESSGEIYTAFGDVF